MMTLNRNVDRRHNENEQIAFGTGVLVDGTGLQRRQDAGRPDLLLLDTQRYRVGPNYLQRRGEPPRSRGAQ